jgi:phosphomevalonate kinase
MSSGGSTVRASAPGKLLLFGEYAVLGGGTALVMAVDRRARVVIEACDSEDLHVVAPQLGLGGEGLVFDADRSDRVLGMTGRLLAERLQHYGIDAAGVRITVDTSALFDRDDAGREVKLGLGSSAAVSAALDVALAAWANRPAPGLNDLLPAYRRAVGGPVSGADLAASLNGGLQRVHASGSALEAAPMPAPEGLQILPVWAGRPASTPAFAAAFGRWREQAPEAAADWVAGMDRLTRSLLDGARAADWVEAARTWCDGLIELQGAIGERIVTDRHRALVQTAAGPGVVYKTCGAGGGDFGVALSTATEALAAFRDRVSAVGGRQVELNIDPVGACVTPGPDDPKEGA